MKVEVEEVSVVERKLCVEVPSQEVEKKLDRAYRNLGKKAKVKGFRPGKAPRGILERIYRKQIEEEVSQDLLRHSLDEALKEVNLRPVNLQIPGSLPVLSQGDDFRYIVELEISPEFTVENYLGLTLEGKEIEVTETMVEQRLEEIQELNAWLKPLSEDRPIQAGDFLLIEYEAYQEGKRLEGGGSENQNLEVGSGRFNPDFEQHLIGLTQGQETDFRVDVPDDFFNPLLAGKAIDFKVKIKETKEKELPTLDDGFAKSLGGNFETLEDLRQAVKQTIILEKEKQRQSELRDQMLGQLLRQTSFEVPPSLVRQEQERILRDQLEALQHRGLSVASLDKEKMLESLRELAERQVRYHLILEKVAEQEEITVDQAEMEVGYHQLAARLGEKVERVKDLYQQQHREEEFRKQLREEKTMVMLIDKANIITPTAPTETSEVEPPGEGT